MDQIATRNNMHVDEVNTTVTKENGHNIREVFTKYSDGDKISATNFKKFMDDRGLVSEKTEYRDPNTIWTEFKGTDENGMNYEGFKKAYEKLDEDGNGYSSYTYSSTTKTSNF